MTEINQVGQIVQIVSSTFLFLAVVAAFLTAYLNWRNSPILMATKEKHSSDLMTLLSRWKDELSQEGIPDYTKVHQEQRGFSVEKHILFEDLKNHIPKELRIFELWREFLAKRIEVDTMIASFYQETHEFLENRSGIHVLSREETNNQSAVGITYYAMDWLYLNILWLAQGSPSDALNIEIADPRTGFVHLNHSSGNRWAYLSPHFHNPEVVKDFFNVLWENLRNDAPGTLEQEHLSRAKEVVAARKELAALRDNILDKISEAQCIPILTGNCRHIDRARERLWPFRRTKIPTETGVRKRSGINAALAAAMIGFLPNLWGSHQVLFILTSISAIVLLCSSAIIYFHKRLAVSRWGRYIVDIASKIDIEYTAAGLGLVSTGISLINPPWLYLGVVLILIGFSLIWVGGVLKNITRFVESIASSLRGRISRPKT
jgi:uncharacterized membrane protein